MIERCRVSDVASGIIRDHCDVITHFVLLWITEERIERNAHRDVGRPRISGVDAVRIEELRIGVVSGVSSIQPNGVYSSIWRDRKCAEPVPFAVIDRIIIDTVRGAKGLSAIGAAHEHHVNSCAEASWLQAPQHVNVVISTRARTVHRDEKLPI